MPKRQSGQLAVNNLVVVSDLHMGCRFGLCPPNFRLDGGGSYRRSALQNTLWLWWNEFWNEFVPHATKGEPYAIAINGDMVDGRHHRSTTQISQNLADQRRMAETVLAPLMDKARGLVYGIRGTPAHAGESSEDEESIAEHLGFVEDDDGHHMRNELNIRVGRALVNLMHHIGTTGRQAYESSGPMAELTEMLAAAAKWGYHPPDLVVRSHRHTHIEVVIPTHRYRAHVLVTPGWQGKTPFVWKINARVVPPQFGGIVIRQGADHHYTESYVRTVAPSKVVVPTLEG